jgi:hypothetical protein
MKIKLATGRSPATGLKCRCAAALKECSPSDQRCPASAFRIRTDYERAMRELQEMILQDAEEKGK